MTLTFPVGSKNKIMTMGRNCPLSHRHLLIQNPIIKRRNKEPEKRKQEKEFNVTAKKRRGDITMPIITFLQIVTVTMAEIVKCLNDLGEAVLVESTLHHRIIKNGIGKNEQVIITSTFIHI